VVRLRGSAHDGATVAVISDAVRRQFGIPPMVYRDLASSLKLRQEE
jgi:hypothetical protein